MKAALKIALGSAFVGAAFPIFAFAQVTSLSQTDYSVPDQNFPNTTISFHLGQGFTGNAIGAALYVASSSGAYGANNLYVNITQFSDAGYTTDAGDCDFQITPPFVTPAITNLAFYSSVGLGCTLDFNSYVRITVGTVNGFGYHIQLAGASSTPTGWVLAGVNPYSFASPYLVISGLSQGINWNAIYTPLVYSTSSAAIAASSTLWGAYASTTQLATVCNSGNFFTDAICTSVAYLIVPNPQLLSGIVAIPSYAANRAPFSLMTSMVQFVQQMMEAVATTSPNPSTWHYSAGGASTTLTIFDASSSTADWPLVTTMRNYAGDFIYIGWAISVLFLVYKIV